MKETIYFIAALPMPIGGVTVYNQRKLSVLKNEYNVIHLGTNKSNLINFLFIIIFSKKEVIISSMNFILIFLNFFSLNRHVTFIDHNASRYFNSLNFLTRLIYKFSLNKAKKIVIVDDYLKNNYKIFGNKLNFKVESAFIPPVVSDIDNIIKKYPIEIRNLKYRNCVIASISKPYLNVDGEDVYNSELILECFEKLALSYRDVYFVVGLSDVSRDSKYAEKILDKAENLSLNNKNIFILKNGTELWPLFEKGLIYFRPTLTDGDSITLREAIHFGCKSLVSDVVPRPKEAILFNFKRDKALNKLEGILENLNVSY